VEIYTRLGSPRLETEKQRDSAVAEARLTSSHADGIRVPATIEPGGRQWICLRWGRLFRRRGVFHSHCGVRCRDD